MSGFRDEEQQSNRGEFTRLLRVNGATFLGDVQKTVNPPQVSAIGKTDSQSRKLISQAIAGEYRYAMLGLILGLAAILGGVALGLHGVTGSTSWTAKILGFESKINDAAPGVVLFIVGLFMVFVTKPRVDFRNLKG